MAEEKTPEIVTGSDDMHVLRVLMHSIKGLSPVSITAAEAATYVDND